jgi:thiamine-phosphate pyrophosphorylase
MKPPLPLALYLVTDRMLARGRPLEEVVAAALLGGVTMVQLREKECSTREFIALAERILPLTRARHVPLIINDRVDVALAVDADGVHLGQSDMPCATARRLLGPDRIIGLSVESTEQAEAAQACDADYLGVSPIHTTPTKPELETGLGLDGLRRIRALSRHPLVAIGGMNAHTIPGALSAGADGVAVVSAICAADDPEAAACELAALVRAHSHGDHP